MSITNGFQRPTVKVTFDEQHPNHGLVVRGRRMTLGEMRRFETAQDVDTSDPELRVAAEQEMVKIIYGSTEEKVAGCLREWNMLDDDGEVMALPKVETIEDYDPITIVDTMNAFLRSSRPRPVAPPLPRPSAGTPSSVERSLAMAEESAPPTN